MNKILEKVRDQKGEIKDDKRLNLRIPNELYIKLREEQIKSNLTMNGYIIEMLKASLK